MAEAETEWTSEGEEGDDVEEGLGDCGGEEEEDSVSLLPAPVDETVGEAGAEVVFLVSGEVGFAFLMWRVLAIASNSLSALSATLLSLSVTLWLNRGLFLGSKRELVLAARIVFFSFFSFFYVFWRTIFLYNVFIFPYM